MLPDRSSAIPQPERTLGSRSMPCCIVRGDGLPPHTPRRAYVPSDLHIWKLDILIMQPSLCRVLIAAITPFSDKCCMLVTNGSVLIVLYTYADSLHPCCGDNQQMARTCDKEFRLTDVSRHIPSVRTYQALHQREAQGIFGSHCGFSLLQPLAFTIPKQRSRQRQ